jgi:AraC-like DNA-binding protein
MALAGRDLPSLLRIWRLGRLTIALQKCPPADAARLATAGPLSGQWHDGYWRITLPRPVPTWMHPVGVLSQSAQVRDLLILSVPHDLLAREEQAQSVSTAGQDTAPGSLTLSADLARILSGLLDALLPLTSALTQQDGRSAALAVAALLAPCLVIPPPVHATRGEQRLHDRARQAILLHLSQATFGPDDLGRCLGLSRSNLYRRFQDCGGVARFIQRERLFEARQRLCDTTHSRPIHAIGLEVGFTDHSTFSRSFRREFGESPSDCRDAALRNANQAHIGAQNGASGNFGMSDPSMGF